MSVYKNETRMRAWACERLERVLDRDRYPTLFASIDAPKRKERLTLTQLGVLRLLLDSEWRPDRDEKAQQRYGMSACLTRLEISEVLGTSTSTVATAVRKMNILVRRGAAKTDTFTSKVGLILFSDLGYCFTPGLGDAQRSRAYSNKQLSAQAHSHRSNIQLADDKDQEGREDAEILARIQSMTPAERVRLVKAVG